MWDVNPFELCWFTFFGCCAVATSCQFFSSLRRGTASPSSKSWFSYPNTEMPPVSKYTLSKPFSKIYLATCVPCLSSYE